MKIFDRTFRRLVQIGEGDPDSQRPRTAGDPSGKIKSIRPEKGFLGQVRLRRRIHFFKRVLSGRIKADLDRKIDRSVEILTEIRQTNGRSEHSGARLRFVQDDGRTPGRTEVQSARGCDTQGLDLLVGKRVDADSVHGHVLRIALRIPD